MRRPDDRLTPLASATFIAALIFAAWFAILNGATYMVLWNFATCCEDAALAGVCVIAWVALIALTTWLDQPREDDDE